MPGAGAPGPHPRDGPRSAGDREALAGLLIELQRTVATMNRLISAMEGLATRPQIHMDVAHLDVGQLDFHLGSIDVESLTGELNVGVTHKLPPPGGERSQGPEPSGAPPEPERAEPPPARTEPAEVTQPEAPGPVPRTLARSVVTRWREQGRPAPEAVCEESAPVSMPIWPPPTMRGGETT